MTVVVVGPFPPPTHGAARVTAAAAALVRGTGTGVEVYDTGTSGQGLGYHARRLHRHLLASARVARAPRVSAVYVGGAGGFGLWYQVLVILVARLRRVPVVFHHHSSQYLRARCWAMVVLTRSAGNGLTHVTLSEGMADRLRDGYPGTGRTLALSNVVFLSVDDELPIRLEPSCRLVLGHLSNLSRAKGLDVVLETFEGLRNRGLDVELRLAGPVSDAADDALIEEARLRHPERLVVTGRLDPEAVPDFLAGLDLFLFPSRYRHEAEPLVVLEAAAVGVPTVSYAVGSLAEVVGATGGWLVPREESFCDVVVAVLHELQRVGRPQVRRGVHADLQQFKARNQASLQSLLSLLLE